MLQNNGRISGCRGRNHWEFDDLIRAGCSLLTERSEGVYSAIAMGPVVLLIECWRREQSEFGTESLVETSTASYKFRILVTNSTLFGICSVYEQ